MESGARKRAKTTLIKGRSRRGKREGAFGLCMFIFPAKVV
jgi:hypothetical protein